MGVIRMKRRNLLLSKAVQQCLLDLYPTTAPAYASRKLRAAQTIAYVVRNDSGVELPIGFSAIADINNNYFLDEPALLAHCGSGNGYITVTMDQSGLGVDEINTTAALQPRIVVNGVINKTISGLGKPAPYFTGGRRMSAPNGRNVYRNVGFAHVFMIYERVAGAGFHSVFYSSMGGGNDTRVGMDISPTSFNLAERRVDSGAYTIAQRAISTTLIHAVGEINWSNGNATAYVNGVAGVTTALAGGSGLTSNTSAFNDPRSGVNLSGANPVDGNIPEFIQYNTDQSANRAAISLNQKTAYGTP